MNKKVYVSALILVVVFLCIQYVLKIFFPEAFLMIIEEPNIVLAGQFIDANWWLYFPIAFIFAMVSDYLFFAACCKTRKPHWSLWLIMICYNVILISLYTFAPYFVAANSNLIVGCSMAYMFLVPIFYTNELKPMAITYVVANVAQLLTLAIRDFTPLLTSVNTLTTMLLSIESYLWATLCYIIFTKGGVNDGMDKTMVRQRTVLGEEKGEITSSHTKKSSNN